MGFSYQDAVGEDLCVMKEKSYMGKQVFSTGKTVFTRSLANEPI